MNEDTKQTQTLSERAISAYQEEKLQQKLHDAEYEVRILNHWLNRLGIPQVATENPVVINDGGRPLLFEVCDLDIYGPYGTLWVFAAVTIDPEDEITISWTGWYRTTDVEMLGSVLCGDRRQYRQSNPGEAGKPKKTDWVLEAILAYGKEDNATAQSAALIAIAEILRDR